MNTFYKHLFAVVLLSVVFSGCSHKSKATTVGFAGEDQNVTVGHSFTVTANSTLSGNVQYTWKEENGTTLSRENTYEGTLSKGEHILTAIATNDTNQTESDTVSIKVGKYFISRSYTDTNGDGVIDDVRIYTYDEEGKLLTIKTYKNVNGDKEPEKNGIALFETETFNYDANGNLTGITTTDKDGKQTTKDATSNTNNGETTTSTTNADGGKTDTVTEADGTKRTFTYDADGHLTSGTATPRGGKTITYVYETDENGNITKETQTDASGNIVKTIDNTYNADGVKIKSVETDKDGNVTTITYDDNGHALTYEETDKEGNSKKRITTSYDYIFMWKYKG